MKLFMKQSDMSAFPVRVFMQISFVKLGIVAVRKALKVSDMD